jgi:hypothetical protein
LGIRSAGMMYEVVPTRKGRFRVRTSIAGMVIIRRRGAKAQRVAKTFFVFLCVSLHLRVSALKLSGSNVFCGWPNNPNGLYDISRIQITRLLNTGRLHADSVCIGHFDHQICRKCVETTESVRTRNNSIRSKLCNRAIPALP